MNKFNLKDYVLTPDGDGQIREITLTMDETPFYTVALKIPFKVIDPYTNERELYPDMPYLWGHRYREEQLEKISGKTTLRKAQ